MEINTKEVDFKTYCHKCKHREVEATLEPCNTCLDNPVNEHTTRPVKFEEDKNKKKG